ncbi:MAG: hypothetical protein JKY88_16435 [Pseudomonadales bacterium]|nr:hypothetical protein [Pseudomonadales bacterium]
MSKLTQQLDEPTLSINASSFESNTPFHHLASSLHALLNHNEEAHRDQLRNLRDENQRLQTDKQSQINSTFLEIQEHQRQAYLIKMSQ